MSDLTDKPSISQVVHGGRILLIDLFGQLMNLIVAEEREVKNIGEDRLLPLEGESQGNAISVRALRTSIIILQFGVLEALANFIAEVTIQIHCDATGAPPVTNPLTQVELDLLKEQRTLLDTRTGELRIQQPVYQSILDKLAVVPLLFARAYGLNFRLDKSVSGWNKIARLKELRDALTHIRLDCRPSLPAEIDNSDLDRVRPSLTISSRDLFSGSEAIIWYGQQIKQVCIKMSIPEYKVISELMVFVEFFGYMQLINLHSSCGITKEEFTRMYPMKHFKYRAKTA